MTQEKKKRVPKPPMTGATQWVVEAIPILESYQESWKEDRVKEALTGLFSFFFGKDFQIGKGHDSPGRETITWIRDFLRSVLVAMTQPEKPNKGQEFLYEAENLHATHLKQRYHFSGEFSSDHRVIRQRLEISNPQPKDATMEQDLDYCRAVATNLITESLDYNAGQNGLFYFGICAWCGKLFKKKFQTNQELCGKACKQAIYRQRTK